MPVVHFEPLPRCHVCQGRGKLPEVVYTEDMGPVPLTHYVYRCYACGGTGLDWK